MLCCCLLDTFRLIALSVLKLKNYSTRMIMLAVTNFRGKFCSVLYVSCYMFKVGLLYVTKTKFLTGLAMYIFSPFSSPF
jgi:hypothetical protein